MVATKRVNRVDKIGTSKSNQQKKAKSKMAPETSLIPTSVHFSHAMHMGAEYGVLRVR
jgi:hypothetical protein